MSAKCGDNCEFDGADPKFRRALIAVIIINTAMFVVEMVSGHLSQSRALMADALDFFADAVTYGVSLAVIGMSLRVRSLSALGKGISLAVMGLWVMGSTIYNTFILNMPEAKVMGGIALLALAANLASVLFLRKWKDGDANVRSVWICSRNDAIGNVAVMLAAVGVFGTGTAWPDLLVAGIMAFLFLNSARQIIQQARREMLTSGGDRGTHGGEPNGKRS